MADDDAKATIRAFWLREVKNLRDRCHSQRLELNQKRVTNLEIAEVTGIPPTTLSDLLSCNRDVVPDWDRVSLIIDYLGGTTGEWVPNGARPGQHMTASRSPMAASKRRRTLTG